MNLIKRMTMKKELRNVAQIIHLTPSEKELFMSKAKRYRSVSAMIRDAVAHYDDRLMMGRIDAVNSIEPVITAHQKELSRLGNNLNQVAHYCNGLAQTSAYHTQFVATRIEPLLKDISENLDRETSIEDDILKKLMKSERRV